MPNYQPLTWRVLEVGLSNPTLICGGKASLQVTPPHLRISTSEQSQPTIIYKINDVYYNLHGGDI